MRLAFRALGGAAGVAWRESFPLGGRDVARWFPGHMAKGERGLEGPVFARCGPVAPAPARSSGCPRAGREAGADRSPEPQKVPSATLFPQASVSTSESTETYFPESCFEYSMKWW